MKNWFFGFHSKLFPSPSSPPFLKCYDGDRSTSGKCGLIYKALARWSQRYSYNSIFITKKHIYYWTLLQFITVQFYLYDWILVGNSHTIHCWYPRVLQSSLSTHPLSTHIDSRFQRIPSLSLSFTLVPRDRFMLLPMRCYQRRFMFIQCMLPVSSQIT